MNDEFVLTDTNQVAHLMSHGFEYTPIRRGRKVFFKFGAGAKEALDKFNNIRSQVYQDMFEELNK